MSIAHRQLARIYSGGALGGVRSLLYPMHKGIHPASTPGASRGFRVRSQMGFRPGRNTVMAIFVARRLFEEIALLQSGEFPAILIFVDFIKAFDSVLWDTLDMGCPCSRSRPHSPDYRHPHAVLYEGSTTSVRTQHGFTPPCPLQTGVWQGCVLSPYSHSRVKLRFLRLRSRVKLRRQDFGGVNLSAHLSVNIWPEKWTSGEFDAAAGLGLARAVDCRIEGPSEEAGRGGLLA
eukprot:jgi/Mesvir1/10276/Mv26434-RA.1